jgi:hypothetical protein
MAGATPIYSFPYPESSDLVAAYPALGQDLAEDIETVIAALPPGGLAHIATESFSAVSSVSLNGVFTSAYENYRLIIASSNSAGLLSIRWRVGGTDNTSSSYARQQITARGGTVAASSATDDRAFFTYTGVSGLHTVSADIFQPQITANTLVLSLGQNLNPEIVSSRNYFTATTSFDGFTISTDSGNITGTLRVYGYANS